MNQTQFLASYAKWFTILRVLFFIGFAIAMVVMATSILRAPDTPEDKGQETPLIVMLFCNAILALGLAFTSYWLYKDPALRPYIGLAMLY